MSTVTRILVSLALVSVFAACARPQPPNPSPRIVSTGAAAEPAFGPDTLQLRGAARTATISIDETAGAPAALVILNGVVLGRYNEAGRPVFRDVPPSEIASIEVVQPAEAVRRFGADGAFGALLIRTK